MTFLPTDYLLVAAVVAVVLVRIITDIRETMQLQRLTQLAYTVAQRHFSPKLTIIMPVRNLDDTKHTAQQLQLGSGSIELLVAVDAAAQPSAASKLRYFLKKHALGQAKVISSKQLNLRKIAATRATGELVVLLPDTARLSADFYRSALLPFGNPELQSLQLASNIRPSNTISSALETLHLAWTRYMWWLPGKKAATDTTELPEGLVVRRPALAALTSEQHPSHASQPSYSTASRRTISTTWHHATRMIGTSDYLTVGLLVASGILLASVSHNVLLILGVIICLFIALSWWALAPAQLSLAKRLEIILLAPVFFATLCAAVATHSVRIITRTAA